MKKKLQTLQSFDDLRESNCMASFKHWCISRKYVRIRREKPISNGKPFKKHTIAKYLYVGVIAKLFRIRDNEGEFFDRKDIIGSRFWAGTKDRIVDLAVIAFGNNNCPKCGGRIKATPKKTGSS
jgi:hypothetical protein